MQQRDNRPGSLGRPSLFSEAPGALGEDKNILKQLDVTLAASARVTPGMRSKRGVVGGLLVLCAVMAGLAWTYGQADRPPATVRAEALAPPQAAAPSAPAPAPAPVAAPVASPETGAAASAAGAAISTQTTVTQPRAAAQPHDPPPRHAAGTARDKPAATADRRGHKAGTKAAASARQSAGKHAKARGKDKSVAHAAHRAAGKRDQARVRKAARRDVRGRTRDSDAALLEALLVHERAFGAAKGKGAAAAGHCDPVKGSGANGGHGASSRSPAGACAARSSSR